MHAPFQHLLVLEERVRQSGSSLPRATDFREHWPGIRLRLDEADYVVRIDDIAEILEKKALTRIPGCAGWMKGVLNLRGRMLPVYGLADYFQFSGKPGDRREAMEILVVEKGMVFCGIAVDEIYGMEKFYQDAFRPASNEELKRIGPLADYVRYVNQVGENICRQLDIEALALTLIASNPSFRESAEEAEENAESNQERNKERHKIMQG